MTASAFNRLHALIFASLTLASSVLAGVYITNPVANTTARPGELLTVRWVDDGTKPHLASIGPSQIALYTGSATQQTFLQQLAANIDVSTVNSLDAWIDANVGPSGEYYFVRITSNGLMDAAQPMYPYQSYSARFSLNNMAGDFNASVWQQLTATPSSGTQPPSTSSASIGAAMQSQSVGSVSAAGLVTTTASSSGRNIEAAAATTGKKTSKSIGAETSKSSETTPSATVAAASSSMTTSQRASTTTQTRTVSASTTSSRSAAGTRLSAPFKVPQIIARANQPGSPEGRTAALMVTSVLFGVFGFGLAVAL